MFNLLTEQAKKGAMREYRARLMIIALVFLCVELLLAASGGVFSFAALRAESARLAGESDVLHRARVLTEETALVDEVNETKARLGFLASPPSFQLIEAVSAFISLRTVGIQLIVINALPYKEGGWTISASGVAATRDALAAFERAIRDDRRFADVDFPLGSFAKEKDISFNASAVYKVDLL